MIILIILVRLILLIIMIILIILITESLVVVPISQASADQRAGRAGRVRSGLSFSLHKHFSISQKSVEDKSTLAFFLGKTYRLYTGEH